MKTNCLSTTWPLPISPASFCATLTYCVPDTGSSFLFLYSKPTLSTCCLLAPNGLMNFSFLPLLICESYSSAPIRPTLLPCALRQTYFPCSYFESLYSSSLETLLNWSFVFHCLKSLSSVQSFL